MKPIIRNKQFLRKARLGTLVLSLGGALGVVINLPSQAQVTLPDAVEVQSLEADAFAIGTLTQREGALPTTLWNGSEPETLDFLLENLPDQPRLPVVGKTLRRVLMSSGEPVRSDAPSRLRKTLGGKKLLALVNAGFIEEARTLASLSDAPLNDSFTGKALVQADLLTGNPVAACDRGAALATQGARSEPFWVKLRAFCFALSGERDAADLTLSLMRDQGILDAREEDFLTAVVTGRLPGKVLYPRDGLELAVLRQINSTGWAKLVGAGGLPEASGAVVRALADDVSLDMETRLRVARRAVAMGVMSAKEYGALLEAVSLDESEGVVATPSAALQQDPSSPITDAIVWQGVRAMTAPEFLRDKASLIADALKAGQGFNHHFTLNSLYADEVATLEGALVSPEHAALFARSRMSVGDGQGAGRWLLAMKGDEDVTNLGQELTLEFITLTGYLGLLDPITGKIIADSAGIVETDAAIFALEQPVLSPRGDAGLPAKLTQTVFDAAMGHGEQGTNEPLKKKGQAALAALIMTDTATVGANAVQTVVMEQGFAIAGLSDVRRELLFQSAWKSTVAKERQGLNQARPVIPATNTNDGLTPSLKPSRRGG